MERILKRLPIRLRMTVGFAAAMTLVLAGVGFFVYLRLGSTLDQAIDDGLLTRADDVAALVRQSESGLREGGGARLADEGESFAQVVTPSGGVLDTTPQIGPASLVTQRELALATNGALFVERDSVSGVEGPARLLLAPIVAQDQRLFVVVGASTEERTEALQSLLAQLLIGGPLALALASALAYALAAAALRPVEAMRRQAAAITATSPERRLPVPPARDEVARLGGTLNEMLGRLEAAIERERSFVADASHELRTPLAMLKTELELALRRTRTPEELEAAIRSAAEETERLAQLAEGLLVLARADQGRLLLRQAPVDVGEVLATVAERFASRAAAAGRLLKFDAPTGLSIPGDRIRLEQAMENLVDNALRHGSGRVRLTARREEGSTLLSVADEGSGFPPEFAARAFERFSRADEARSTGGAGLGLAIVDAVARAHGGSASVSGATVTITVPS